MYVLICKKTEIERYKKIVEEGKAQPNSWEKLRNQAFLSSDDFVDDINKLSLAALNWFNRTNT